MPRRNLQLSIVLMVILSTLSACAFFSRSSHRQVKFDAAPLPHGEDRYPNWQYPPQELEEMKRVPLFIKGEFVTLEDKRTETGTSGASVTTLYFPSTGQEIKVKWKEMTGGILDSYNNSPRKQMAAYEIQKLFLEPEDYVVPTVAPVCFPLEYYNRYRAEPGDPSIPGITC